MSYLFPDGRIPDDFEFTIVADNAHTHRSAFQLDTSSSTTSGSSRRRRLRSMSNQQQQQQAEGAAPPPATPRGQPTARGGPSSRWHSSPSQEARRDTTLRTPLRVSADDSDSEGSAHREDIQSLLTSTDDDVLQSPASPSVASASPPASPSPTSPCRSLSWPSPKQQQQQQQQQQQRQQQTTSDSTNALLQSSSRILDSSLKAKMESLRIAACEELQTKRATLRGGGVRRSTSLQNWLDEPRGSRQAPSVILQSVLDDIDQLTAAEEATTASATAASARKEESKSLGNDNLNDNIDDKDDDSGGSSSSSSSSHQRKPAAVEKKSYHNSAA